MISENLKIGSGIGVRSEQPVIALFFNFMTRLNIHFEPSDSASDNLVFTSIFCSDCVMTPIPTPITTQVKISLKVTDYFRTTTKTSSTAENTARAKTHQKKNKQSWNKTLVFCL